MSLPCTTQSLSCLRFVSCFALFFLCYVIDYMMKNDILMHAALLLTWFSLLLLCSTFPLHI